MGQKALFQKQYAPFGMLKQVFLAHFEPDMTHFGPWKIPKARKRALLNQKWTKIESKPHLSKSASGRLRVHQQVK